MHRQSPKFLRYNHDQPKPAGIDQSFERGTKNTTKDGRQIDGVCEQNPWVHQSKPQDCARISRFDPV